MSGVYPERAKGSGDNATLRISAPPMPPHPRPLSRRRPAPRRTRHRPSRPRGPREVRRAPRPSARMASSHHRYEAGTLQPGALDRGSPPADPADQQVGPASGRRDGGIELPHQAGPDLLFDERHLATPALIGIADQTTSRHQSAASDLVHRSTVRPLDPDCLEPKARHPSLVHSRLENRILPRSAYSEGAVASLLGGACTKTVLTNK